MVIKGYVAEPQNERPLQILLEMEAAVVTLVISGVQIRSNK